MKIIKLVLFALIVNGAFLHAMEKEEVISPLEIIKKDVETFESKTSIPMWLSNINKLTNADLEDLLTFILDKTAPLNAEWLERTFIDRSLPGSLKDISTLAKEQEIQSKMTGMATMASIVKAQWEKKNPEKNIFLAIGAKNYVIGLSDWNWYLHLQTTAKSVIKEVESVNQQKSGTLFADQDVSKILINIIYYSCMLSNEAKSILLKNNFVQKYLGKVDLQNFLETKDILSIRGYAIPFIRENKGEYGYVNLVDVILISQGISSLTALLLSINNKDLPDEIERAFNNICIDPNGALRVGLDLLIMARVESTEHRVRDLKEFIDLIYSNTDDKFLKKGTLIIGDKNYVRIFDWLQGKEKELKELKDKDSRDKKEKIKNFIQLLKELNKKHFGVEDPEIKAPEQEKLNIKKEKEKISEKPSETMPMAAADPSISSLATDTNEKVELTPSKDMNPDQFNADLLNAIKINDDKRVQDLLSGKTITDEAQAKEYLLAAIANGIRFNKDAIEKTRELRKQRALSKIDEKVEKPLVDTLKESDGALVKTVTILRTLSDAIRDFLKTLETLTIDKWLEYIVLSNNMDVIKIILTDEVNYKDRNSDQLKALYLLLFNSLQWINNNKVELIDYFKSMKRTAIDSRDAEILKYLREILNDKKYLQLAGINTLILSTGKTLLYVALEKNDPTFVEFLLNYGASADVIIPDLETLKPKDSIINILSSKMSPESRKIIEAWQKEQNKNNPGALRRIKVLENLQEQISERYKTVQTPMLPGSTVAAGILLRGMHRSIGELEIGPGVTEEERETEVLPTTPISEAARIVKESNWASRAKQAYSTTVETANSWYSWLKNKVQGGVTAVQQGATNWYNYLLGGNPRPAGAVKP